MILADHVLALALTIFFEARGESQQGKEYVAQVVANRVQSDKFPDDVTKVVLQRQQFGWTYQKLKERNRYGLRALQESILHSKRFSELDKAAYWDCLRIASNTLRTEHRPIHSYLYFNNVKMRRGKAFKLGNHYFYGTA